MVGKVGEGTARSLLAAPKARRWDAWRRQVPFAVALAPATALLGLFFVWPALWAIYTGLTDLTLTFLGGANAEFVGLDNYRRMVRDPDFRVVVENTIVFAVGSAVIGQFGLGFALALLLDAARRRGYRFLAGLAQAAVLAAWICPLALAGFVWVGMLDPIDGTLTVLQEALGREPVNWLARSPMLSVIVADVWRGTAFAMLVLLWALRTVPPEIYEAAQVDGAGAWRRFWDQTLPSVRPFAALAMLMSIITTIGGFFLIDVLTSGAALQTTTLALYAYRQAFVDLQIGYGSAISAVMLLVNAVFVLLYFPIARSGR